FSMHLSHSSNFVPGVFREHLEMLRKSGYRFVSWEDIVKTNIEGRKNILLTIDDGNVSVRNIEDILDEFGIKPILFVYPAIVGRVKYALTWDDIQRFHQKGWTIGAHGYYHLYVNKKLYDEDRAGFLREIVLSRQVIEKKIGISVTPFGYPFGVYSPITIETLQKEKYDYGFTLVGKPALWPPFDPYQIPRYLMTPQMWQYFVQVLMSTNTLAHKE
ncbi:MAG: polysaccharide deacetylase family protein, partial [Brevinematales bacterium]